MHPLHLYHNRIVISKEGIRWSRYLVWLSKSLVTKLWITLNQVQLGFKIFVPFILFLFEGGGFFSRENDKWPWYKFLAISAIFFTGTFLLHVFQYYLSHTLFSLAFFFHVFKDWNLDLKGDIIFFRGTIFPYCLNPR